MDNLVMDFVVLHNARRGIGRRGFEERKRVI